jgi:hypothetical protein
VEDILNVQNTAAQPDANNRENNNTTSTVEKKSNDSQKQWGGSLKRGCLASFSVKTLYLLPHISEICIYEAEHVNHARIICHGVQHCGDRSALSWHLSQEIKEFVLTLLRKGFSISQIMVKHIAALKDALKDGKEATRDWFLHEQDVRNLATKVDRETYMLSAEDAKSVQLWVQENADSVFFYQEIGVPIQGGLTGMNMPFTLGIQTPWQRDMMLQFGHEGAVSIDATFGTNEKKVILFWKVVLSMGIVVLYCQTKMFFLLNCNG